MKTLIVTLFALVLGYGHSAHASGCSGPEFILKETRVLASYRFTQVVENHSVNLTASRDGKITSLGLNLFTEKMSVPGSTFFFWHTAYSNNELPQDLNFTDLLSAIEVSNLEIVEDTFEDACTSEGTQTTKNIRVQLNYQGQEIVIKTSYQPY